ncbi:MAG TPA: LysR family transcriptional regulator [Candidatus Binatia bacterium]|nr:LysR family transcriptional regulator [Candidatus Binatia bacterium]
MRVRYLRALRAVVETGSVTEAAQRLSLTQPQVSRLLGTLERELGFALFLRQGRRIVPTLEGAQFYEETKRILSGFDEITRIASDIRTRQDAWLRIVAQPYLAYSLLPSAIAEFAKLNSSVRISMEIRSRADVGHWIAGQQFDLGIVALPMEAPAIRSEAFAKVRVALAVPTGHRLARRSVVRPADIANENFVALRPYTLLRHYSDEQFSRAALSPSIRAETSSGPSACQLVAQGVGVTLADPIVARAVPGIIVKRWEPVLHLTYGFLFPTAYAISSLTLKFRDVLRATVKSMAPDDVTIL